MYHEMIPLLGYLIFIVGMGFVISTLVYQIFNKLNSSIPKILGLYFCVLCLIYVIMDVVIMFG